MAFTNFIVNLCIPEGRRRKQSRNLKELLFKYLHILGSSAIMFTLQYPSFARAITVSEFSNARSLHVFGLFCVLLHLSIDANRTTQLEGGIPPVLTTKYNGITVIVQSTHLNSSNSCGCFFALDRSFRLPNHISGESSGLPVIHIKK